MSPQKIACIPARLGSTRFPGKPLTPISGKPMIGWVLEACLNSKQFDQVILATDAIQIAEVGQSYKASGVKVAMTPSELASGTDRVAFALQSLKQESPELDLKPWDWVFNIQGDEPLLNTTILSDLVATMSPHSRSDSLGPSPQGGAPSSDQVGMGTLATDLGPGDLESSNCVKVLVNENQEAQYFSRFPLPFSRAQPQAPHHQTNKVSNKSSKDQKSFVWKHVGLYAYRWDFLLQFCSWPTGNWEMSEGLEQLRALEKGFRISVKTGNYPLLAVDEPQDVVKVERAMLGFSSK